MAKHSFDGDLKHGIYVNENDSTWILTADGSVTVAADGSHETAVGMYEDDQVSGNHMIVNGKINALGHDSLGIYGRGDDNEIDVGKHGEIHANNGIGVEGPLSDVDNEGHIVAAIYGIQAKAASQIVNGGEIDATAGIWVMTGDVKIANNVGGAIWGTTAITTEGTSSATVTNRGLLSGAAHSIIDGDGELKVVNFGSLYGDVDLGAGDDRFENRGGHIVGHVNGGEGNDVYKVDRASIFVYENANEGDDTILTSSSYKLTEAGEIETLKAVGKKNVNLEGDSGDTTLIGNAGNNTIHADDGKDYIRGGAGDDQLFGEGGDDIFDFSHGCDKDVVRDFAQGQDKIELDGFEGTTFMQLQNKISDTADGTLINLGQGDTILLKGFHDAMTVDDFMM